MAAAPVSAVIVTYNSADHVRACLASVVPYCQEAIVIDNASGDATVGKARDFAGARLLANDRNRGFAGGANQGVRAAQHDTILLLNPDVQLTGPVWPLLDALSKEGAGAAAGLLVTESGAPQAGFTVRRFPTPAALAFEVLGVNRLWAGNPVNRRYRCMDVALDIEQDVEQPAGAFLMFQRDVWQKVRGFDETFHPVWFEDVDFLKRLNDAGYSIRFCPSVVARHAGGHSVSKLPPPTRRSYWYANLLAYAAKHFSPLWARAVAAAVMSGLVLRWLAAKLTGLAGSGEGSNAKDYDRVIRLAARYVWLGPAAGKAASQNRIEANG